jgi:hypothetical protein
MDDCENQFVKLKQRKEKTTVHYSFVEIIGR